MRKHLRIRRGFCLAAVLALLAGMPGTPAAGEAALEEKSLELAGSRVAYPAVTGMADEALQQRINGQILEDLRITDFLQRMNALISDDSRSITVAWSGMLAGEVFSGAADVSGAAETLRDTHLWTWSSLDLRDGHEIAFDELFSDGEAAREGLEAYLEEQVAPEMSAYLLNSELTPLPEGFRLEQTGLTLLYDVKRLTTLSGRAGAVRIGWNEIREWVDWSEESIPVRIGAADMVTLTEDSLPRLRAAAESGQLPDIPVKLGDSVREWTDREHLLTDPDEYAGGRMFALEGAAFRNVLILSDAVSAGWDGSRVQGIRAERGCIWGLCIGETEQAAWRQALGEPDSTVDFDAERAEAYRTVPGSCDYYEFGGHTLQLHSGEDGLLASITLTE